MSGNCIGYQVLHKRLKDKRGLHVGRSIQVSFVYHGLK